MIETQLAVIFDMDGVLIDSTIVTYQVRGQILAKHGVDIAQVPDPHDQYHKGSTVQGLLDAVKTSHGLEIDEPTFAKAQTEGVKVALTANQVRADAELIAFLEELKRHSIPCAIASSGKREGVQIKLNILGIEDYIAVIVAQEDVTEHKPDPAVYLFAAKRLGVPSNKCIVLEDSKVGVQAGKAAGSAVVGFTRFNDDKRALAGADITVDRWSELSFEGLEKLVR